MTSLLFEIPLSQWIRRSSEQLELRAHDVPDDLEFDIDVRVRLQESGPALSRIAATIE